MYCYNCGLKLKDGANFCDKCGTKNIEGNLTSAKETSPLTSNTTPEEIITKHPKVRSFIIVGIVIGVLSVGLTSYYIAFSKFSSNNPKDSATTPIKNKVTPSTSSANTKSDVVAHTDKNATDKINPSDSYIFPKSGSEKLVHSNVSTLTKGNLALARNEIFARHGFVFLTDPFKSYFNKKSWYKENPSFKGSDEELNAMELYNLKLILKYENK